LRLNDAMKHLAQSLAKRQFGRSIFVRPIALTGVLLSLAACSTLPEPAGQLSGYNNMQEPKGLMARYMTYADKPGLAKYSRVHIHPVVITPAAAQKAGEANLSLVSNAIARDMCLALAKSYKIAGQGGADTLEVRAFVTDFVPTGGTASVVSSAIGFYSPISRLPIGLGRLSAEAEAQSPDGQQLASLIWSRDANLIDSGGLSRISDAYAFSTGFSSAFVKLLKPAKRDETGEAKPDAKAAQQALKANRAACDVYGKAPGAKGFLYRLSPIGAAPEWSDKGPAATPEPDKPADTGAASPY
jgi:hypothetical protein